MLTSTAQFTPKWGAQLHRNIHTITNTSSQQVFYSLISQQQFYIDISTWTGNGLYFLTIKDASNGIIEVKKIIIQ